MQAAHQAGPKALCIPWQGVCGSQWLVLGGKRDCVSCSPALSLISVAAALWGLHWLHGSSENGADAMVSSLVRISPGCWLCHESFVSACAVYEQSSKTGSVSSWPSATSAGVDWEKQLKQRWDGGRALLAGAQSAQRSWEWLGLHTPNPSAFAHSHFE